jgi:membrane protease YdiL (CAAX protease family)
MTISEPSDVAVARDDRQRARRGLALFFTLVIVFEAVVITAMVVTGMYALVVALMWSVALASVIARLVLREGFADVSFRLGGRRSVRWFVIALLFPQFVGFVAFGAAWLTGLALFTSTAEGFWTTWLAASTVGTLVSCVYAAGEEIGWRGYMLTRLIAAGVPRPVLVSGLIWGLWHVPLILVGLLYAEHPFMPIAAVVFVISATATAFVLARARLESGSLWPCILLHGAYNSVIQAAFWPAAAGGGTSVIWVDMEAGILVSAVLVLAAVLLCRGSWVFRRTPDEPMAAPAAL